MELIGVSDVDRVLAEEIAAMHGTQVFTDYKKLLSCDLDAVSVAVPTTLHKTFAMDVINEGMHLLVEKPIASRIADADEMLSADSRIQQDVPFLLMMRLIVGMLGDSSSE